ncbi:MAG: bifunctional phosphoribosylaminoimidazolecarboxamide formyltransferase/IMP cyclohydrolase [Spirochaetales bacterium]|nr:bifunctional phosphoribosylaminoimidazolecarboxamide formyltransferase/IMP cyclohydrolase [Spirochaetales bacterium]
MAKRALLSVYDKTGIVEFARFLINQGYSLLSTGGTFRELTSAGVEVEDVASYTGSDEILDGRVKTLHPKVHGGLLGRRDDPSHCAQMKERGMDPIDVVVVNLYPFFEKSGEGLAFEELVEFIDIGGPTMIRSAAKNHAHVAVFSDPADYAPAMEEWQTAGGLGEATRRRLAGKVFALTGAYDSAVAAAMLGNTEAPQWLSSSYAKAADLRYGENPHQKAAWYVPSSSAAFGALSDFHQHQGKELSFNNLRDLDGAWRCVSEFSQGACVGVKHAAPCGVALGDTPLAAWEAARDGDPVSIFGGIAAFNREVDASAAESLCELFLEVIAAPGYTEEALKIFEKKKNLRVLTIHRFSSDQWEALPVDGGICLQETDHEFTNPQEWTVATTMAPTPEQMVDLEFAWKVAKHVKSNGIVVAKNGRTLGIGSGQPNRVGAVRLALDGKDAQGAVMASDAFFPFDDGVKTASAAGVSAIVQPGGSVRDGDSIAACDASGMAMVFTGKRHFRH